MLNALGLAVCALTEPTGENLQQRIWSKREGTGTAATGTGGMESTDDDATAEKGVGGRDRDGDRTGGTHGLAQGPGLAPTGTVSSLPASFATKNGSVGGGGGGGGGLGGQGGVGPVDVVVGRCLAFVREALAAWSSHHGRWTHGESV